MIGAAGGWEAVNRAQQSAWPRSVLWSVVCCLLSVIELVREINGPSRSLLCEVSEWRCAAYRVNKGVTRSPGSVASR
jgi:hypothetical protein